MFLYRETIEKKEHNNMVGSVMNDWFRMGLYSLASFKEQYRYVVPAFVAGCIALAIGGLCYLYYTHMHTKEEMAHALLTECIAEYQRVVQGQSTWASVEVMCKAGYEQYAATKTATYFIPLRVDALLALGNQEMALQLLDQLLGRLGTTSPVYALFATKRALIKLDNQAEAIQGAGLKELQALANDTKNLDRDVALYYLARYYASHHDAERARETQEVLAAFKGTDHASSSPWASLGEDIRVSLS